MAEAASVALSKFKLMMIYYPQVEVDINRTCKNEKKEEGDLEEEKRRRRRERREKRERERREREERDPHFPLTIVKKWPYLRKIKLEQPNLRTPALGGKKQVEGCLFQQMPISSLNEI